MPDEPSDEPLDVVLLQGPTDDGKGAQVLRARGERLEVGEVRPMREGCPLSPKGEIVRLTPRREMPGLFNVQVEHAMGDPPSELPAPKAGPAQVATDAYRQSWERTFGPRRAAALN